MIYYFGIGFNFLICVACGVFWGVLTTDWWGKRWGIPIGVLVFSMVFYSIFNDYADFMDS